MCVHDEGALRDLAWRINYGQVDATLREALTHASVLGLPNNERLEFLGDAVLDLVVAEALLRRHPTRAEGWLTRRRADMVNTRALAEQARRLGLPQMLVARAPRTDIEGSDNIAAAVFEAVVGALYTTRDYAAVYAWIERLMASDLAYDGDRPSEETPKSRLQRLVQAQGLPAPRYVTQRLYDRVVAVVWAGDKRLGSGAGPNRKAAEVDAAREAIADPSNSFDVTL